MSGFVTMKILYFVGRSGFEIMFLRLTLLFVIVERSAGYHYVPN